MGNLGVWCAFAVLGILMGKEFLDWVWWYIWGDDEDEPNPGPIISKTWAVWDLIDRVRFWLWLKIWRIPERWIDGIWYRFFPPEPPKEPTDRDGRTPRSGYRSVSSAFGMCIKMSTTREPRQTGKST